MRAVLSECVRVFSTDDKHGHGSHAVCFTFYVFSPCVCQYVRAMTGNTHAASMTTQADDHGHASEFPERLSSCNGWSACR